jgi:hypothetical protein
VTTAGRLFAPFRHKTAGKFLCCDRPRISEDLVARVRKRLYMGGLSRDARFSHIEIWVKSAA